MRSAAVPTIEYTPVFDWTPPRLRKLSLISFIAASTALHALCFYLFQIVYPPTVALLPPPARVNVITDTSEEGRLLLRWIEAEDPALSSTTIRPPDAASYVPPTAKHVPSYANWRPLLRQMPPLQADLSIPSAQPPGPVQIPRAGQPKPAPPAPSELRFGSEAAGLGEPVLPPLRFTFTRRDAPQSAEFRIAISGDGVVRHAFLERSSGDASLDEQARRAIALSRFPQIQNRKSKIENLTPLFWTTATLEWGNDIALPEEPGAAASKP
ncbi:hypothetical protein BH18VER1_BH18VER1_03890 [soil metagenome]